MATDGNFRSKLCPEVQAKSEQELGETPGLLHHDLQMFRELVMADEGLICPHHDDEFLLMFLRVRRFNYNEAVKLIHNYYESRIKYPELYVDFNPLGYMELYRSGVFIRLKREESTSPQVIIVRPVLMDHLPIENLIKAGLVQLEYLIRKEENHVNGFVLLIDMAGMTWSQALQMTPSVAKRVAGVLWNAMPARIKAVHHISVPSFFEYLFGMIRPFLSELIQKRIRISSTFDYLKEKFSPSILPEFFGGEVDTQTLIQSFAEELTAQHNAFKSWERYGLRSMNETPRKSGVKLKSD